MMNLLQLAIIKSECFFESANKAHMRRREMSPALTVGESSTLIGEFFRHAAEPLREADYPCPRWCGCPCSNEASDLNRTLKDRMVGERFTTALLAASTSKSGLMFYSFGKGN